MGGYIYYNIVCSARNEQVFHRVLFRFALFQLQSVQQSGEVPVPADGAAVVAVAESPLLVYECPSQAAVFRNGGRGGGGGKKIKYIFCRTGVPYISLPQESKFVFIPRIHTLPAPQLFWRYDGCDWAGLLPPLPRPRSPLPGLRLLCAVVLSTPPPYPPPPPPPGHAGKGGEERTGRRRSRRAVQPSHRQRYL